MTQRTALPGQKPGQELAASRRMLLAHLEQKKGPVAKVEGPGVFPRPVTL